MCWIRYIPEIYISETDFSLVSLEDKLYELCCTMVHIETMKQKFTELAGIFCIPGEIKNIDVISNGNINATYDVSIEHGGKEYYVTEVPELMAKHGLQVETYFTKDGDDLRGINTPEDLEMCERILEQRGAALLR